MKYDTLGFSVLWCLIRVSVQYLYDNRAICFERHKQVYVLKKIVFPYAMTPLEPVSTTYNTHATPVRQLKQVYLRHHFDTSKKCRNNVDQ
jgi:hypothetical protein